MTHPTLHVSDPGQLNTDNLDCAAFKSLNDLYLAENEGYYYRTEIIDIEEKAFQSDRLKQLLKGRKRSEVKRLIGLPRIESTEIVDGKAIADVQNELYCFGYLPITVCITYKRNRFVDVYVCPFEKIMAIDKRAFLELKKHALGKSVEEIEKYLHHRLVDDLIPAPPVSAIPVENGGPAEKSFDVGKNYVWNFHFVEGKCTEIHESLVFS